MAQQFSQNSFSHAPHQQNGYLYDEPKPKVWRLIVPVGVVLFVGALAYSVGKATSARMTNQIQNMDVRQVPTSLVQKSVIGEGAPEFMVPQPTFEPPPSPFFIKNTENRAVKRSAPQVAPSKNQPIADTTDEKNLAFAPAEDYPAGTEAPDLTLADTELSRNEIEATLSGQNQAKPSVEAIKPVPEAPPVLVPESPAELQTLPH